MTNRVPSNYSSLEVLQLAQSENPNPSPVLEELFKRCRAELSDDPPVDSATGRNRRVQRASIR
jgi:hypothetical protein